MGGASMMSSPLLAAADSGVDTSDRFVQPTVQQYDDGRPCQTVGAGKLSIPDSETTDDDDSAAEEAESSPAEPVPQRP